MESARKVVPRPHLFNQQRKTRILKGQGQREAVPMKGKEQFAFQTYYYHSIVPNAKVDDFKSIVSKYLVKIQLRVSFSPFHAAATGETIWLRGRSCMVAVLFAAAVLA